MMFNHGNTVSYTRKLQLIELSKDIGITLDGEPAVLFGAREPWAYVGRVDGCGGSIELAWPTVERILNQGGNFKS